ncbi:transposase [Ligilactobacillus aviarius]|uniref:transposase n=1 Tax=Ligilactobacillus aviarius TaxID=1606 RepID=UPI0024BB54DC|nr:transposase [Ligilactobacillus aviarius]
MDTAVSTLKGNIHYIENACYFNYSNGPIEGINCKIKELKRHCYGFRNLNNFLIALIVFLS